MSFDQDFNIRQNSINYFDSFQYIITDSPSIYLYEEDTSQWSFNMNYPQIASQTLPRQDQMIQLEQDSKTSQSQQLLEVRSAQIDSSYSQIFEKYSNTQKNKKIKKQPKAQKAKKNQACPQKKQKKKSAKLAADCNNFGKLLIGTTVNTVSAIGQTVSKDCFTFHWEEKSYQQQHLNSENSQNNLETVNKIIEVLKQKARSIPRKNGDRRNLNPIFNHQDNTYQSMQELEKFNLKDSLKSHVDQAKQVLREQLLFVFDQQKWIENHSAKKQFKTDVDQKKKNYQKYLKNVKQSLLREKGFAKRIDKKIDSQDKKIHYQDSTIFE